MDSASAAAAPPAYCLSGHTDLEEGTELDTHLHAYFATIPATTVMTNG
jgi:hypothetical protein